LEQITPRQLLSVD